jgi:tRNA(His) 5'-end guanylyltransferase
MEESKDTLGDRLKAQEAVFACRGLDTRFPIVARLDGKAFHTFTRGLKRPFDERLSKLMVDTTSHLVEKTHAHVGYTQSDEITLVWLPTGEIDAATNRPQFLYSGRDQKLTSILAGCASAFFMKGVLRTIPEKEDTVPHFDCRIWNVPDARDAYLNLVWRQQDAVKNSISMAAQALFSHAALHRVGSERKKEMLREVDRPWEDMPRFFKMGTFVKRQTAMVNLTEEQLSKIPEKHRPTGPVERSNVGEVDINYLSDYKNDETVKAIFN